MLHGSGPPNTRQSNSSSDNQKSLLVSYKNRNKYANGDIVANTNESPMPTNEAFSPVSRKKYFKMPQGEGLVEKEESPVE